MWKGKEDLKPCSCGESHLVLTETVSKTLAQIRCENCGVAVSGFEFPSQAVEAWNRIRDIEDLYPDGVEKDVKATLWQDCFDVLTSEAFIENGVPSENLPPEEIFKDARRCLEKFQEINPENPPSIIVPEPAGGIIIEWIEKGLTVTELTFYS